MAPSPNSRSKTTCGLFCIGSGDVGPCHEIVWEGKEVDLSRLPVQTCWPGDAAPLITWGLTVTRGPAKPRQNLGIYRQQVLGRDRLIMRWLAHRGGALDFQDHQKAHPGASFPVAVVLGADPATTLAAVTPLPDAVSDTRGVLAANMETAVNGLWDATPRLGDRVAVIGAGVVGCMVAALAARIPGVRVELIDTDPRRAAVAARLGCAFAAPAEATGDADLVIHSSGSPEGLATALGLAGFEATVLEMSWYGDAAVTTMLGGAFHSRRLRLISSQVGRVAPSHRPRWTYTRRLAAAVALLSDPRLDALLAPAVAFDDLPDRLPEILDAKSGTLCQPIVYS